jgi:hypothetical protein
MMMRYLMAGAGVVVVATTAPAQTPVKLQSPASAVDAAFNRIAGVRELPNAHLLVIDQADNQLWDVDLRTRTRVLAGASGIGLLDYDKPHALFAAGENTIVEDFGARKFLWFSSGAKAVAAVTFDSLLNRGARRLAPRFGGADDAGHLYFEVPAIFVDANTGAHASDSSAILRIDRKTSRADTVAFLHLPPGSIRASGGRPGEGMSVVVGADNPFAPHPAWTVTADGSVAIVHAAPYHVEWIDAGGARRVGPTITYEKIPVTAADIRDTPAGFGASTGTVGPRGSGGPATNGGRNDWPAFKSPFARGDVRADARGRVWVRRASRAGDATRSYDVLDRSGRVVARYVLPEQTRVIAVGASSVCAIHSTSDGERLEVFRLP